MFNLFLLRIKIQAILESYPILYLIIIERVFTREVSLDILAVNKIY